jgi:hypothetical protein
MSQLDSPGLRHLLEIPIKSSSSPYEHFIRKSGLAIEHGVDGPGDLCADDGVGRVLAFLAVEFFEIGIKFRVGPLAKNGRLHEGPLEVWVSHLAPLATEVLPSALVGPGNQP